MLVKLVGVLSAVAGIKLVRAKSFTADGLPTVSLPLTVSGGVNMIYTVAGHIGGKFTEISTASAS